MIFSARRIQARYIFDRATLRDWEDSYDHALRWYKPLFPTPLWVVLQDAYGWILEVDSGSEIFVSTVERAKGIVRLFLYRMNYWMKYG